MKLYIVRHGESASNASGVWTGWQDVPLTEKGILEARALRPLFSGISFDRVFASDLQRAWKTGEEVLPNTPYEKTELLREINLGTLTGMKREDVSESVKAEIKASGGYKNLGGEAREEFVARIDSFLKMLEGLDCENVAVFAHAGVVRTVLDLVIGIKLPRDKVNCSNCALGVFEYQNEKWTLHSWLNQAGDYDAQKQKLL